MAALHKDSVGLSGLLSRWKIAKKLLEHLDTIIKDFH